MECLDSKKIMSCLSSANRQLMNDIHCFTLLDSTNTWLLEHSFNHKHRNVACLAEKQTKGRGRRGNTWQSSDLGNIYMSLSWYFDVIPTNFSLLGLMVGISLCETLQALGLSGHGLKWPNDIYIDNQKLAGILVETADNGRRVIIGVGLNVSTQSEPNWCGLQDFINTGLGTENTEVNRLSGQLLDGLVSMLHSMNDLAFEDFKQQWSTWDAVYNKAVYMLDKNRRTEGIARGIDKNGQIIIELEKGQLQHFHSAEISLRW